MEDLDENLEETPPLKGEDLFKALLLTMKLNYALIDSKIMKGKVKRHHLIISQKEDGNIEIFLKKLPPK